MFAWCAPAYLLCFILRVPLLRRQVKFKQLAVTALDSPTQSSR